MRGNNNKGEVSLRYFALNLLRPRYLTGVGFATFRLMIVKRTWT
jgi:hypothetical protein